MEYTYTKYKSPITTFIIISLSIIATCLFAEKQGDYTFLFSLLGSATGLYLGFGKKAVLPILLTTTFFQLIIRVTFYGDSFFKALLLTFALDVFLFLIMFIFKYLFQRITVFKDFDNQEISPKHIIPYFVLIIAVGVFASLVYTLGLMLLTPIEIFLPTFRNVLIGILFGLLIFNPMILISRYYFNKGVKKNASSFYALLYLIVYSVIAYLIFSEDIPAFDFYHFSFVFFLMYIISSFFFGYEILFFNNIIYVVVYSLVFKHFNPNMDNYYHILQVNIFLSVMTLTSLILIILNTAYIQKEKKLKEANQTTERLVNTTNKYFSSTDFMESNPLDFFMNFIKDIFEIGCTILPKYNRSSCYIREGSFVKFISCKNYDLNVLNALKFNVNKFHWGFDNPIIIKNFDDKHLFNHKEGFQIYEAAYGTIKESICFSFKFGDDMICGMSFDISSTSNNTFKEEDFNSYVTFQRLVNSYKSFGELYSEELKIRNDIILSFIRTLGVYDEYTEKHSEEVAHMAVEICSILETSESIKEKAFLASCVHDIGKVGISNEILNKPTRLTDEEYNIIKKHTVDGFEILNSIESLKDIAKIVRHHHERWDGRGYPDNLEGKQIPFISQIITVCDSVSAMINDRPYKKAKTISEAIEDLKANRGKQFSPEPCDAMIKYLETKITCKLTD